ncbi:hypothetical protein AAZX31_01G197600 [Glycine max]|uniref:Uncharacterized protein n=2 Tax=Glycine subgen. Soja TaxID=1462606 RepID=I1J9Y2_SOYBN|nr:hypothetical protein GYH30_002290 [Glycine max]KRH77403.1 hypothetical protein GLYMA_01G211400v4 [Glycine max]RZC31091.1 hypothetical protein D0Y65_002199 [Glycine soja]
MATLSFGIATTSLSAAAGYRRRRPTIVCIGWSRDVPDTPQYLIEYFLDTEAQEIEFEIARMRPRLNEEFFAQLKFELTKHRFLHMEDRQIELEALEKAIQEGLARANLTKILTSKDVKATLLEMVEKNEINRSLLALQDENIASAQKGNQKQAAEYMEKLRGAVLRYITV